jgi:hypothetical protein
MRVETAAESVSLLQYKAVKDRLALLQEALDNSGKELILGLGSVQNSLQARTLLDAYGAEWFATSLYSHVFQAKLASALIRVTKDYPFLDRAYLEQIAELQKEV